MDQCVAIVKASVQRKSDCAGGEEEWEVEGERLCGEKKIRGEMKKVLDVWQESRPLV